MENEARGIGSERDVVIVDEILRRGFGFHFFAADFGDADENGGVRSFYFEEVDGGDGDMISIRPMPMTGAT